jgi:HAE1 family hydrophobic/amphiphilic exporter-1
VLRFFHSHRVSTAVIIFLLLGAGIALVTRLPFALLPVIEHPSLLVSLEYSSAHPEVVEQEWVSLLEERLKAMPDLDGLTTEIGSRQTLIACRFTWGSRMDVKYLLLKDRLDSFFAGRSSISYSVQRSLRGRSPSVSVAVWQQKGASYTVRFQDWARDVVLTRIASLEGVQAVDAVGLNKVTAQVTVRSNALLKSGLSRSQLQQALSGHNPAPVSVAVREQGEWNRFFVSASGNRSLFDRRSGLRIPLDSLVTVAEKPLETSMARYNGKPAVVFSVYLTADADIDRFSSALDTLLHTSFANEPEYQYAIHSSTTGAVQTAKMQLAQSFGLGLVLAMLILWIFIGSLRRSLAVFISVPVSFAITFIAFYALDIPLHLVSVASLILACGVIIDNAIIIIAFMDTEGDDIRPLVLPLSASTFTNIGVFVPFFFLRGFERALFRDLIIGYSVSMLAALVVALLFTPALVRIFAGNTPPKSLKAPVGEAFYQAYHRLFMGSLRKPGYVLALFSFGILAGMFGLFTSRFVFLPEQQQVSRSVLVQPASETASGAGNRWMHDAENRIQRILNQTPGVGFLVSGGDRFLPDASSETRRALEVELFPMPDTASVEKAIKLLTAALPAQGLLVSDKTASDPLSSLLFHDREENAVVVSFTKRPSAEKIASLDSSLKKASSGAITPLIPLSPVSVLIPRRDVQIRAGLDDAEVADAIRSLEPVSIVWEANGKNRNGWLTFETDTVPIFERSLTMATGQVAISSLFTLEENVIYPSVIRLDNKPVVTYLTGTNAFYQQARGVFQNLKTTFSELNGIHQSGRAVQKATFQRLVTRLLLFSFMVMFGILLAQFEHFGNTMLILSSIPFAWLGSFTAIALSGQPFTLYTLLGLVIVTGISVNDAILKVSHFHELKRRLSPLRALVLTSADRFKPVVMTTLTTILAMTPVLFSPPDLNPFFATAASVIGGLIFSTLQSLFLIPLTLWRFHRT